MIEFESKLGCNQDNTFLRLVPRSVNSLELSETDNFLMFYPTKNQTNHQERKMSETQSSEPENNNVIYATEFDVNPKAIGRVELSERQRSIVLAVVCDKTEIVLIDADRDQWGVWLSINGTCLAQEDGTRSFLDGLIKALTEMRRLTECDTKEASVV